MKPCEVCQGKGFVEEKGSVIGRAFLLGATVGGQESDNLRAECAALRKIVAQDAFSYVDETGSIVWCVCVGDMEYGPADTAEAAIDAAIMAMKDKP